MGGIETHLTNLIDGLEGKYEIMLIYSGLKDPLFCKRIKKRFSNIKLFMVNMNRGISLLKDMTSILRIYQILKKEKPDLVHCHSSKAGLVGRIACRLAGIRRVLYSPHGWYFYGVDGRRKKKYIYAERMLAWITSKILITSESEKQDAMFNRIGEKKIIKISNGVSIGKPKSNFMNRRNYLIVSWLGRFSKQKNPSLLFNNIEHITKELPDVKFLVVGKCEPPNKRMQALIEKLKSNKKIIFFDWQEEIKKIYDLTDIYVSTSLYEGLPYTSLEIMALKKPVVATNVSGNKDIVVHNETGFLVNNEHELIDAIIKLARDDKIRKRMGENSYRRIKNCFNINDMISSYEKLYNSLLNEK